MQENFETIGQMLRPVFEQNSVVRAAIFGSYARGEQTAESDMDFIVAFADGASLLDLGGLYEDIGAALGRKIDVITYHSLEKGPKGFSETVLREARLIYEAC